MLRGVDKMRWPFFKKREKTEKQDSEDQSAALMRAIAEKHREDPLIGAKIGAKEIVQRLLNSMKDNKGIHVESLLCALGALAGYSCQASVRSQFVDKQGLSENQVFAIVGCANGQNYYFGDMLNKPLIESQYSIWSLAGGAAQHLGAKEMIDINEVFKYVTQSVGSENFGIPRIAEDHKAADIPANYLKHLWPVLFPIVEKFCTAAEWPILFGLAIQEVMFMGKGVIDPLLAFSIVMESAVPMSKVDFSIL
jgi:hypothetical protein